MRASVTAVALLVLVCAGPASAKATRETPPTCPPGRFLIEATQSYHTGIVPDEVVVVAAAQATLGPTCGTTSATIRQRRNTTIVRARWKTCPGRRRVTLVARIAADCATMTGVIREVGDRRRFGATRSTCGDGRWDQATEPCDAGVGCPDGVACRRDCTCATPVTTTTTSAPTTTTTLTPPVCTTEEVPFEGQIHEPEGTPIVYQHNPPASGNHYPVWARWEDLPEPIARGYWVHNLEHGGIVIVYRPDAPADVQAELHRDYAAIPNDPDCVIHKRALMTPDPLLDPSTPWAIIAHDLVMTCDRPGVEPIVQFAVTNRNHGAEDDCRPGLRP